MIIFHRNILAGVVGHECCRYQAHHCASSDIKVVAPIPDLPALAAERGGSTLNRQEPDPGRSGRVPHG
jgi:hypothetical protein